jgi:hypothetical protein
MAGSFSEDNAQTRRNPSLEAWTQQSGVAGVKPEPSYDFLEEEYGDGVRTLPSEQPEILQDELAESGTSDTTQVSDVGRIAAERVKKEQRAKQVMAQLEAKVRRELEEKIRQELSTEQSAQLLDGAKTSRMVSSGSNISTKGAVSKPSVPPPPPPSARPVKATTQVVAPKSAVKTIDIQEALAFAVKEQVRASQTGEIAAVREELPPPLPPSRSAVAVAAVLPPMQDAEEEDDLASLLPQKLQAARSTAVAVAAVPAAPVVAKSAAVPPPPPVGKSTAIPKSSSAPALVPPAPVVISPITSAVVPAVGLAAASTPSASLPSESMPWAPFALSDSADSVVEAAPVMSPLQQAVATVGQQQNKPSWLQEMSGAAAYYENENSKTAALLAREAAQPPRSIVSGESSRGFWLGGLVLLLLVGIGGYFLLPSSTKPIVAEQVPMVTSPPAEVPAPVVPVVPANTDVPKPTNRAVKPTSPVVTPPPVAGPVVKSTPEVVSEPVPAKPVAAIEPPPVPEPSEPVAEPVPQRRPDIKTVPRKPKDKDPFETELPF